MTNLSVRAMTRVAFVLAALLGGEPSIGQDRVALRPNFVVIYMDDLGFADISAFGETRYRTPRLERMAREGRRFTSFYVAASVCTPSRAGLMTGSYPARVDMLTNDLEMDVSNNIVLWPGDRKGLNPDEVTIAEMLKARGYATACIGKWHLGDQLPFLPTRQGFDEYFGIPFSNDMADRKPFFVPTPLVRSEHVIENLADADQDLLTKRYTEEALGFIERNAHRPFFLYLPHSMVHGPHHRSDAFKGKSGKGVYGDTVLEMDWSVGRILDKLTERNLAERTLVLFTSDNGGPYRTGSTRDYSANTPFSGGKGRPSEGGFRVPTIAWWPGSIPAGTTTDLMASALDLLPTFAALSGKKHEPLEPIDGIDISTLFKGPLPEVSPRRTFAYFSANLDPVAPSQARLNAVREGSWKYYLKAQRFRLVNSEIDTDVEAGALFDLASDLGETTDVAADHPEIVKRMRALAERLADELGDVDRAGWGVRKAAYVETAAPLNANR